MATQKAITHEPEKVTAIARRQKAGALVQDRISWTDDQIALIQRTVANGTSPDEFKLFLYQAARTGLDPLAKQIYAVRRGGKMTIQTGIDGYRLVADRTGKYAGSDDAVYSGKPGTAEFAASVTIYKIVRGVRCPFSATARWSEYYPGDQQGTMWRKMPHTMLGKCAEACALRKGFPSDLSGVYTREEMDQAGDEPIVVDAAAVTPPKAEKAAATVAPASPTYPIKGQDGVASPLPGPHLSTPEIGILFASAKGAGITTKDAVYQAASKALGVAITSVKQIPSGRLDDVIRAFTGEPAPGEEK